MEMSIGNENNENTLAHGFYQSTNVAFLEQAMHDECDGIEFALERIRVPSGGITAFEVPAGDGESKEYQKEIECVILLSHPSNTFYMKPYDGSKNPPDCGSQNGTLGIGKPGGSCKDCPYNQFGSGKGKAKACKNRRMMYLLVENELFPMMLILPPGSLKSYAKYVQSLLTKGKRLHEVVTRISLKTVTSAESGDFSQVVFKKVRELEKTEQENIEKMIRFVGGYDQKVIWGNSLMIEVEEEEKGGFS